MSHLHQRDTLLSYADVVDFMHENIDNYITKQYLLVGLEDVNAESGVKFYLEPRDEVAIQEKVANAIEDARQPVERFTGMRFDKKINGFKYGLKFENYKKTYSYASADIENGPMKEEFRNKCLEKRTLKKYKNHKRIIKIIKKS